MELLHDPKPIVSYLKRHDLSQQQFASLVRVSQSAVSQWLAGTRGISIHTAKRIQKRTKDEITIRDLFQKLFGEDDA